MANEVEIVGNNEHGAERAVATREQPQMPTHAMERTADEIVARLAKIRDVQDRAMDKDVDFGLIPGTGKKPMLLKPGAEKLCVLFNLDAQFTGDGNSEQMIVDQLPDGTKLRHLLVKRYCTLYSQASGARLGGASAICSTMESKYAWRKAGLKCPNCGKDTVIKGKAEYGGGWLCWKKEGRSDGCGNKWPDGSAEIEGQKTGRVPNEDIADQYNTVVRMAEKRALVAAVRLVTGASAIFDEEYEAGGGDGDPGGSFETEEEKQKRLAAEAAKKAQGAPEKSDKAKGGGRAKKATENPPTGTGGPTQATSGGEGKVDAETLGQIEEAFGKLEFEDDEKRALKKRMFLAMFTVPKEGDWKDVTAKQGPILLKTLATALKNQTEKQS